jgi:hypothetical protein
MGGRLSRQVGVGEVPVDERVEEGVDVLRARVAEVHVVRVLPHVDGEDRLLVRGQRRLGVAGLHDLELVAALHQPGPAGAELRGGRRDELLTEGRVAAEAGVDGGRDGAGGLAAAAGLHAVPVERVVPDLGGVVEDAARRVLHDLLEARVLLRRAGDELVQVGDVRLVVLAVVVVQRLGADVGGKAVFGPGQGGKFDGHGAPPGWEARKLEIYFARIKPRCSRILIGFSRIPS